MIPGFDYTNPYRETYLLAWPAFMFGDTKYHAQLYKRPLNATIGSDGYLIHRPDSFEVHDEAKKFHGHIFKKSGFYTSSSLRGTILEVPDIDDVVCLRMMDPEMFVKNKGRRHMGDNEVRDHMYPRIFHITPKVMERAVALVGALDTVSQARSNVANKAWALDSFVRNMTALLDGKPADDTVSKIKAAYEAIPALVAMVPSVKKLQLEIERRKMRCDTRRTWIRIQIRNLWGGAKFKANNYA